MKVIQLTAFGLENLAPAERPDLKPGPGQVVLRMKACSLNFRDLLMVKGLYNPRLKMPMVPLSDGVGEVAGIGEGVTRVKVGERVAGIFMQKWLAGAVDEAKGRSALGAGGVGMLAEQVCLHEDGVVPVPAHLTDEEAATLPCAAVTAWNALFHEGNLKPGDTVLLQGTGGVSLFALQFAKLAGARILITSSSDDKLKKAIALGAHEGINYKTTPEWEDKARELTGGAGVDQIIEVGGAGTLGKSLKAVKMGGTISLIGVLSGGAGQVNPMPILMKNVRTQGIFVGSREMFEAMNKAIALEKLRPVVDRVFGFGELRQALAHLESGAHFGKVALRL